MEGSPSDLSTSNMKARCEICVKEFANLRTMKRHFTLLHKTHNYQCDICRKVYRQKSRFEKHGCKEKKSKCQTCGKVLSDKYSLLSHIATKHTWAEGGGVG